MSLETWTLFSWSPQTLEGGTLAPRVEGSGYHSGTVCLNAELLMEQTDFLQGYVVGAGCVASALFV